MDGAGEGKMRAKYFAWVFGVTMGLGCGSSDETNGSSSAGGGASSSSSSSAGGGSVTSGSTTTSSSSTGAAGGMGGSGATGGESTGGMSSGGSGGAGGSGGSASAIKTVFVIVMENKAWCAVLGKPEAPYINGTLVTQGASAENYTGPNAGALHPSEPNYIWMEAGDALGVADDNDPAQNHQATTDHLVTYLDAAGVSWKSYQQGISGTVCPLTGVGDYKPKHNPMVFFDDVTNTNDPNSQYCIDHNRPLTELETDLTNGTAAKYNFITPDQCHDMHDSCAPLNNQVAQGDAWLAEWIPKILASPQYQNGGAIFVTWDESESTILEGDFCCLTGNCPIGMIALSPLAKPGGYTNTLTYDHSSLLKSVQEIFGATPLLGHAKDATTKDLADLFTTFP